MIRVLHFSDPEQAHLRIAFLGVPEPEAHPNQRRTVSFRIFGRSS